MQVRENYKPEFTIERYDGKARAWVPETQAPDRTTALNMARVLLAEAKRTRLRIRVETTIDVKR